MAYPKDPEVMRKHWEKMEKDDREKSHAVNQKKYDEKDTQGHDCVHRFEKEVTDYQWHEGYNRCYGIYPMILNIWYSDQDGCEDFIDNWTDIKIRYCPFCGKESIEQRGLMNEVV
jgi:hypothetical protein